MATITPFNSLHLPRGLLALVALTCVVGGLAAGYQATLTPITLVVDGQPRQLRTHQDTVGALLLDAGLTLYPEDRVTPSALDTPLEPELVVQVERACPVVISADGHTVLFRTHATSVEQVLLEAHVSLGPHDEVEVEGAFRPVSRPAGLGEILRRNPAVSAPWERS